jgi:hypothetical protein
MGINQKSHTNYLHLPSSLHRITTILTTNPNLLYTSLSPLTSHHTIYHLVP